MANKRMQWLNSPPFKDEKSWRKVFADQKFNAKKKISFNKASKQKTGGGPYEEMVLTCAEEQIIQATGLMADVEGLSVKTYGKPQSSSEVEINDFVNESMNSLLEEKTIDDIDKENEVKEKPRTYERKEKVNSKLSLVTSHVEHTEDYQRDILAKCDSLSEMLTVYTKKMEEYAGEHNLKIQRLVELKERSLKIKEEEHQTDMAIKQMEFEIKSIELEMLKQKNK